jgi:hypothetical protein
MKNVIKFVLFVHLSNGAFTQSWLPIIQDTIVDNAHELWFDGSAQYNGNSLNRNLASKLFYGGDISAEIKDENLSRMKNVNLFYSDIQSEVSYRNTKGSFFRNKRLGWSVKMGVASYLTANFTTQAFQLAFYGNGPFVGKIADISGSRIQNFTFEKIGFGLIDKKTSSSLHLNFVNLTNYTDLHVYNGGLYQSPDIDTLQVLLNGKFRQFGNGSFSSGLGASVDIDKRFHVLKNNGDPLFFRMELSNIGIVRASSSRSYRADTLIEFTGVTFDDLTGGVSLLDSSSQLLNELGILSAQEKSWVMLPFSVQLSKMVNTTSKSMIQEFYGVRMFYLSDIQVFAGVDFCVPLRGKIKWHIGTNLSYGGSANFMLGNYSHLSFRNVYIGMVSENLLLRSGESFKLKVQCVF